jgi:DAK2 domain fusion protein YloV
MNLHLDGALFVQMVMAGYKSLDANKDRVNALNVFPVPDGDTGTNMSLSMTSGVNELRRYINEPLYKAAEAVSTGLLMGARGNSGVILSQLFRGFSKAVSKRLTVSPKQFAEAIQNGVTTAYSAVVKPVEGTILTVAKDAAKAALQEVTKNPQATLLSVMEATLTEAERSLERTPDLLPVLRQAGVVDSGGQGLVYIYRGWLAALKGESVELEPMHADAPSKEKLLSPAAAHGEGDSEYGYCTEFIIRLDKAAADEKAIENKVRDALMPLGDSMLVVAADDLVKVHIHALRPGSVLDKAIEFGALTRIKIDNMTEQHNHLSLVEAGETAAAAAKAKKKPFGIVTVVAGDGLADVFKSLGVEGIIEGGQTMNPSTEDIVNAVKKLNAEHVFILPNNSNIIMAAQQAQTVLEGQVTVIPTKSIPQGIAAALTFDPNADLEANRNSMSDALTRVKSGQITQAVRDSNFQDLEIKEGDFMGLAEGKVVALGKELELTALSLLEKMVTVDSEVVTVFFGDQVTEEEARQFVKIAEKQFDHCEFELHAGGQPLYSYIFSVE